MICIIELTLMIILIDYDHAINVSVWSREKLNIMIVSNIYFLVFFFHSASEC